MSRNPLIGIGWLILAAWIYFSGGTLSLPSIPWLPSIVAPAPTAAVYVYEKDNGGVPPAVSAALNELNATGLRATVFEEDTVDGSGETPDQYKAAMTAAREAGLPALVVMAGDKVARVVKAPATKESVLEAVQ